VNCHAAICGLSKLESNSCCPQASVGRAGRRLGTREEPNDLRLCGVRDVDHVGGVERLAAEAATATPAWACSGCACTISRRHPLENLGGIPFHTCYPLIADVAHSQLQNKLIGVYEALEADSLWIGAAKLTTIGVVVNKVTSVNSMTWAWTTAPMWAGIGRRSTAAKAEFPAMPSQLPLATRSKQDSVEHALWCGARKRQRGGLI
jgi:hypothetical protein